MDGAGDDVSAGDQMLTARSWDKNAMMSMGKAFFTQTATTADREAVAFHLPYYGMNEKASRPILRLSAKRSGPTQISHRSAVSRQGSAVTSDYLTVIPDQEADKYVSYTYGRDGMKWITNDSMPYVYLMDSRCQSRISLLDAAPTEVDIPLGVQIPASYLGGAFCFSLPEKEAFAGYSYVWLIDRVKGRTVNLMEEDYETDIAVGQQNNRFAVRIGGFPMTDSNNRRTYLVFTKEGSLFIRGLIAGDRIDVYTSSGQLVYSGTAAATEWSRPLPIQLGYVIKINDKPYKILNI